VLFAQIDDHAGRTSEVAAIHKLFAVRAWDITYRRRRARIEGLSGDKIDDRRLLLLVCADRFERLDVRPQPPASETLSHRGAFDPYGLERPFASRTVAGVLVREHLDAAGTSAAVAAKFGAEKHQAKTRRTGDGLQTRAAKLALCAIACNGPAAVRTIQGFGFHSVFIGHLSFVIGHWSLVIGHWSLVICHSSFVIRHSSFVIGHLSFVIGHLSFVIGHWSLVDFLLSVFFSVML
jgi:hypothetical protein